MFTVQLVATAIMNASDVLLSRLVAVNSAVNVLYDVVNESPQNIASSLIKSASPVDL